MSRAPREGARSISRFRGSASREYKHWPRAGNRRSSRSRASKGLLVLTARSPDAYVGGPCNCQEASFDRSPAFHREDSALAVPSTPTSSSSSSLPSLSSSSRSLPSGMIEINARRDRRLRRLPAFGRRRSPRAQRQIVARSHADAIRRVRWAAPCSLQPRRDR